MNLELRRQIVEYAWNFIENNNLNARNKAEVLFDTSGNLDLHLDCPEIINTYITIPFDDLNADLTESEFIALVQQYIRIKMINWNENQEFANLYDPDFHNARILLNFIEDDENHLKDISNYYNRG